ncbi:hypothetical protein NDA11_003184 [Ustilago hordei]|nr:hypothetical protein NDA11_003184 [Ustilago hordei]
MATTSPAPTERPALRSNNRRRGWVIASEDGSEVERPTSFDARRSAAAWNKGNGPSKASIPSRASSLASPAASPTIPSAALQSAPIETPSTSSTTTLETRPVPPPRVPSSSGGHGRDESTTSTDAESSTGKRRPSPPLLAPPKQTYRKVPSTRALPPSAWSDHQKFMAAAGAGPRPTSLHTAFFSTGSSSTASASQSPTSKKPPTLRSDMALLAAQRRSNSSSGSSAVTMSSSAAQSTTTPATSAASTPLMAMQNNGKEKALARSTLQDDDQEFFSSSRPGSSSSDASSNAAVARPSSQQSHVYRATPKTSFLFSPNQLPPLSEKSANSDLEDALTSTSEHASDSEATISTHAKPGKRRDSVRIELPPPPAQFKDRYPSIMVDSTHASDSEANGANNCGQRRRRRRSTASNSNKLGAEGEDDEDDYADDDSSWPSTPSTTPLEAYFAAADAGTRPHRKTVQRTKEIIAPASNSIGMDRPMVVVTSPSTASEVSSDQHSSSGSGSTSDRVSSSSPPAAPVLSKIEEHPVAKAAASKAKASSSAPPRRSLSFELPAVPRTRASEENLPIATPVRSPSRTMAFLAKINPTRTSNNRSSADLASSGRPEESVAAVEQAKRMSLDGQKRTSSEQRRSVELRPILLNAASRPPSRPVGAAAESDTTGQAPAKPIATSQEKQQRRRSSGRVPIRQNVVPYHSRRSSEISVGSSNVSPLVQDRGSFDEEASDSRYSPSSQETALTMPSPAMSSDAKPFSAQPARTPDRRSSTAGAKKDRFAASMPSLHQQQSSQERMVSRRTPSHKQAAENRPSAIGLLVDSQKGRMTRDNESIAEWISVSVNDLPLPAETQTYGNGGAGEFSNKKGEAKKARKNKPWKFGRFAASEVVLPAKNTSASPISPSSGAPVLPKRRPISFVKRASTAQVNNASRASADSAPAPQSGPFMRNLGFTTANRNVVLQSLCAERSISALAASTIYIAGCGRINVPQPGPKPDGKIKSKAKSKAQDAAWKRQSQRSSKAASMPAPVEEVATDLVSPCYSAEASHDAYLNVAEERHTGYSLSGTGIGTVKSMVPEMGDWSGSSHHDSGPNEEVQEVRPFRDYDDEGSDLFDSDRSESQPESEDEMDFDEDEDEDAEVPVRFGQRINLANSGETASPQVRRHSTSMQEKNVDKMAVSKSLESISPGVVMLRGAELRVCVEEDAGQDGEDLAYWKVQQTSGQSDNADQASQSFEGQVRRQPSSKAMKLEQEVATGIFAAFVGNRSPRRQAVQRTSFDAGSSKDQGSPQKRSPVSAKDGIKGLLVSKLNEGVFSVRSEVHSTIAGEEQVVEIVRHSGGRRSSLQASSREASDSTDGAVSRRTEAPLNRLERAFPSPLLTNADFSHNRSQSNQTDGSRASLDESERVTMRIQRHGGRGFVASFQSRDGHQWVWQGSKLEASVFAPSKKRTSSQGLDTLEGYDLSLRAVVSSEMIELATFSTESQLRNALGLFKPRGKWTPKPLPEDGASVGPAVPPPAQVLPLAVAMRGLARAEPQVPRRGIRGGPLLRPQPPAAGCAARHHGMWQNQRAAISTEAVVQVHNNAVNNTKASLQLNDRPGSSFRTGALGSHRRSVEVARPSDETVASKKMGELSFSAIEHLDRDLVVLSLLTVMGVARV